MSKKKLMIIGPVVLLLVVGVAYKKVLAPKPVPVKKKIEGHLFQLDPEFVMRPISKKEADAVQTAEDEANKAREEQAKADELARQKASDAAKKGAETKKANAAKDMVEESTAKQA